MSRNANRSRAAKARGAVLLFASCVAAAATLPSGSLAQQASNMVPAVKPKGGDSMSEGFILEPGHVDTAGWTERNKAVTVNFTLRREDKQLFRGLRVEDVEAKLNGSPVKLRPDALEPGRDSQPVKVLFVVDRSGSMVDPKESSGADKLRATREALHYIVNQLGKDDEAAIVVFDVKQDPIVPLTSDKRALDRGINGIQTQGKDTNLYDAIDDALERARNSGIGIIVFLSDGMEDTKAAKDAFAAGSLSSFKHAKEQRLGRIAREQGIRFYPIAVGEPGSLETLHGVDYNTLKEISAASNVNLATLINIPDLNRQSGGSPARLNANLTEKLKDVLTEIKKQWQYAYGLRVALPEMQEGRGELELNIGVDRGDNKRDKLRAVYSYEWDKGGGPPIFSPARLLTPIFIDIKPPVGWAGLTQIYLLLLSPLVLLALLPSVVNRIGAARELRRVSHAIEQIGHGSSWQGKLCPNEIGPGGQRFLFKPGDTVLVCPKCNTAHHLSCWEYNQHQCMNRVCEYQFVVPPRVLARHGIAATAANRQYV